MPYYKAVTSVEDLQELCERVKREGLPFGLDIETGYDGPERASTSVQPDHPAAKVVGFSFTNSVDWAVYVPIAHDGCPDNVDPVEAARCLWYLLSTGLGVAHNAKFEIRFLRRFFVKYLSDDVGFGPEVTASNGLFQVLGDTMLESYVVADYQRHGLKALTKAVFGHDQAEIFSLFPDLPKNREKKLRFNTLALTQQVIDYASEDALWCLRLHHHFYPRIEADKDTGFVYRLEMQILYILVQMEDYGVCYDWDAMASYESQVSLITEKLYEEICDDIHERTGEESRPNLNSSTQVGDLLYNKLALVAPEFTATGRPAANAKALSVLTKSDPLVAKILRWRELSKLHKAFLVGYREQFDYAPDRRVRSSHNQAVVASGRFSLSSPNYQQAPKKYHEEFEDGTVFDLNFRDFIVAPPGHNIIGFDYSQAEYRVMASLSGEPALVKAFADGVDVHVMTAAMMFGVPVEEVTKDLRGRAKGCGFGLMYGSGAATLGKLLGVETSESRKLLDLYFGTFSSIKTWKSNEVAKGRALREKRSVFGRRFNLKPYYDSGDRMLESKGDRMCVNALIQGTAADYIKVAMVRCAMAAKSLGWERLVHPVMNIHDALEFYVHESIDPLAFIKTMHPMVVFDAPQLSTPMKADWHYGKKWGSVTDVIVDRDGNVVESLDMVTPEPVVEKPMVLPEPVPVVRAEPEPSPDSRTLQIRLTSDPTQERFNAFVELVKATPGDHSVRLVSPTSETVFQKYRTSLTPRNRDRISSCFPGCEVSWEMTQSLSESMMDGIWE